MTLKVDNSNISTEKDLEEEHSYSILINQSVQITKSPYVGGKCKQKHKHWGLTTRY